MAGGRESLLFVILLVAGVSWASELVPLIAWSNSDVLSSLRASEDIDEIATSLSQAKPDLTVLFITNQFSFDDLAKYGGVFGDESGGAFSGLKTSLKKAESQYWSGVSPLESTWIVDLSHLMEAEVTFVDPSASSKPNNWRGLVVVDLSVFKDYADKDAVVENVMSDLEKGDSSFVAVFTQCIVPIEEKDFKPRSERNAGRQVRVTDSDDNDDNNYCPISFSSCPLFCMKPSIMFLVNNETGLNCNLTKPGPIVDTFCSNNSNYAHLTLSFNVTNGTNSTQNVCQDDYVLINMLGGNNSTDTLQISFTFVFTTDNSSAYAGYYNMTINATVGICQQSDYTICNSSTVALERDHPELLYDNFTVPVGLSYACSANMSVYNNYSSQLVSYLFNGPVVTLNSIQVQPFEVQGTTFATAYNCVGYFTLATWMGIFTVAVLILVFYLSILCTFSMKTVDRFEDPRGQTILVEKLH